VPAGARCGSGELLQIDESLKASARQILEAASSSRAGADRKAAKSATKMDRPVTYIEQLERFGLHRGVGALEADRLRCSDCGRTPLTGERVHFYDGRTHEIVCELCGRQRREAPVGTELVRHCEHGHTVRLTVRAA
jgi:hypothetical protein